MGKLFGTNGVRGTFGHDLSLDLIYNLTLSIANYFSGKEIIVGCDTRNTSETIKRLVFSALSDAGAKFYYTGVAPTPAHQYAIKYYGLDGGIVITASHNPPEYNGIKVLGKRGDELPHSEEELIEEIYFSKKYNLKAEKTTCLGYLNPIDPYINGIISHINYQEISKARFKVAVDAACGTASFCAPILLKKLNVEGLFINCQPDGFFPSRQPEPLRENLVEFAKFTEKTKANFAIAFDGDADRSIFIDDKGRIVWGDKSGAILAKHTIKKHGKSYVITGVSASLLVEKVIKEVGGEVIWTKVGSVIITEKINELTSKGYKAIGLEENGGFFYTPHQPTRDGCMSLALMLETLVYENKPLSLIHDELPKLYMLKSKVDAKNVNREKVIERISEIYYSQKQDKIDGVRVWLSDEEWFLVRPSGTEPIIRIFAEASSEEKAKKILDEAVTKVKEIISKL
ncbi:MAG: phosphoglucosamine mutase [Thermoproteota archaeon]|jgi:Phosphomannomutase